MLSCSATCAESTRSSPTQGGAESSWSCIKPREPGETNALLMPNLLCDALRMFKETARSTPQIYTWRSLNLFLCLTPDDFQKDTQRTTQLRIFLDLLQPPRQLWLFIHQGNAHVTPEVKGQVISGESLLRHLIWHPGFARGFKD